MPKRKAKPELKVVFDTSVLFTQAAHDLVRDEISSFIKRNSAHPDLTISWYIPSVVVAERQYQMRSRAHELLPSVQKLERLLGHNLNITAEILASRLHEAIKKHLNELSLQVLEVDTTLVDWDSLIERSVYRRPPFEVGEKEKGFRDSVIAESFLQLVNKAPVTPSVCRIALLTNDAALSSYITEKTSTVKNVRVLATINELEDLVNTLVGQLTEEFVSEIKQRAQQFFFGKDNSSSLYIKEKLSERIREQYGNELTAVPEQGLHRENGTYWIGTPVFVRKVRQRIFWITEVSVDGTLYRLEEENAPALSPSPMFPSTPITFAPFPSNLTIKAASALLTTPPRLPLASALGAWSSAPLTPSSILLKSAPAKRTDVAAGKTFFEVHWSVNITSARKLTAPRIETIIFVSTKWGQE